MPTNFDFERFIFLLLALIVMIALNRRTLADGLRRLGLLRRDDDKDRR